MTTVTVELDDLKALVFATGAIKTIEEVLARHARDPMVPPVAKLTEANNRLASAMRNAERAGATTAVGWNDPLGPAEISFLKVVDKHSRDSSLWEKYIVTPDWRLQHKELDMLAAKGYVVIGHLVEGVVWAGESHPMLRTNPNGFAVKLTDRGIQKVAELKQQSEPTSSRHSSNN